MFGCASEGSNSIWSVRKHCRISVKENYMVENVVRDSGRNIHEV